MPLFLCKIPIDKRRASGCKQTLRAELPPRAPIANFSPDV